MNAGIEGYKGGEGKITGRVNVRGAWNWGRIPNGSRRHPEEMEVGGMTQEMARRCDEACKHIPMKETTIHKLGCLISYTTDRTIIYSSFASSLACYL